MNKASYILQKYRALVIFLALFGLGIVLYVTFSSQVSRYFWQKGYHTTAYYLNRKDAELALEIGNYYFTSMAQFDIHRAQKSYELAISHKPNIQQAHYQLARIFLVLGNWTLAKKDLDAELSINPYNLRSFYVRGLIDLAQNDLLSAEFDFSRFIQGAPTEWGGYNDLAFTLAKEGQYAQSEEVVKKAFVLVPNATSTNPWLWNSLGLAQLNQHHYTDAQASFSRADILSKNISPTEWYRAYSANDPSTIQKSIRTFQQAVEKNLYTAKMGDTITR